MSIARKAPRMKCCLCEQPYGAHIQCCFSKCCTSFHATCAQLAGWPLQTIDMNAPLNTALKARLLKQKGFQEGVSCGNGLRLLSYCGKHIACAYEQDVMPRPPPVAINSTPDKPGVPQLLFNIFRQTSDSSIIISLSR